MKAEAQRIAIAKACGFGDVHERGRGNLRGTFLQDGVNKAIKSVPDYLNDLNAMHEAEATLNEDQCEKFYALLRKIIFGPEHSRAARYYIWHATAPQRCEAFLRAIGKWTDE